MANELTISASFRFAKGTIDISEGRGGKTVTVSGTKYTRLMQAIPTSEEAIDIGEVGTPGYCFIRNLDATNYVSIRPATGGTNTMELKAGEFCLFRWARTVSAPFAIANTASVTIEIILIED
jgi:hypothetical protein